MRPVCRSTNRLAQLLLRVHDEGPVARDRLVDRLAAHDEQLRVGQRLDQDLVAVALEYHQLFALGGLRGVDAYFSVDDENTRAPAFAQMQAQAFTGAQPQVESLIA